MEKGISVVIPAYNEEGSIKETLDQLNEVLDNIEHEIRQHIPILYYNIWDDIPDPLYNTNYYRSYEQEVF